VAVAGSRGGDRGGDRSSRNGKSSREERGYTKARGKKDDWRQFFQGGNDNVKFKDEEPDFSEEGWARRRPKKK
jgi:ATP-dependent RNA helicase DeaD